MIIQWAHNLRCTDESIMKSQAEKGPSWNKSKVSSQLYNYINYIRQKANYLLCQSFSMRLKFAFKASSLVKDTQLKKLILKVSFLRPNSFRKSFQSLYWDEILNNTETYFFLKTTILENLKLTKYFWKKYAIVRMIS